VRQRPSVSFQQFEQVYCRHVMQKLKVLWNASSCWETASRSTSLRAAASASSSDESSLRTKFLRPFDRVRNRPMPFPRGAFDSNV
jgi:hypothetical protein